MNVDLVAVVAAGRMVVEFDYIDLGVGIVPHGLMYLVRIVVEVLVLDLDFDFRRLLIISVLFPTNREMKGTYHQNHIPPFASTHSVFHQS